MKYLFCFVFLCSFFFSSSNAFSANYAPYTKEAYNKIKVAGASKKIKEAAAEIRSTHNKLSKEEILRKKIAWQRKLFAAAGYNYDDTVVKVVNDIRCHRKMIPRGSDSVFTVIYVGVHFLASECKHEGVAYRKIFRSDSARAAKWLIENTEFNF